MGSSSEFESEKVDGLGFFASSHELEESSSRSGAGALCLEGGGESESDPLNNRSRALPGGGESSGEDAESESKRPSFLVIER